jgi:hypothetical protein
MKLYMLTVALVHPMLAGIKNSLIDIRNIISRELERMSDNLARSIWFEVVQPRQGSRRKHQTNALLSDGRTALGDSSRQRSRLEIREGLPNGKMRDLGICKWKLEMFPI